MRPVTPAVEVSRGRLDLSWSGLVEVGDLVAVCRLADGTEHLGATWVARCPGDGQWLVRTAAGPLDLSLEVSTDRERIGVRLSATAREPLIVSQLSLRGQPRFRGRPASHCLENGSQSWDASALTRIGEGPALESWWVGGLADGQSVGLAAAAGEATTSSFKCRQDPNGWHLVWCELPADGRANPLWDAREGQTWRGSPVQLSAADDLWAALGTVVGAGSRRRERPAPRGWLSWYHYGPWVTLEDIFESAAALRELGLSGLDFDLIQVDDGWQEAYGDWTPNRKFPGGLEGLARTLKKDGQRLGIWTAPFLASADSRLAREAPDSWFVKDASGARMVDSRHVLMGPMQVLDLRQAPVRKHLGATFAELKRAGIDYFKIDFLYAGGQSGTRALRSAIAEIRRAVGDAYVLACGAPLLPVAGLVDGCRVGQDTATPFYNFERAEAEPTIFGEEVEAVARNLAARHVLAPWFQLDPDVALAGGNLSPEQGRQLVTLAVLSGGPLFLSDRLRALPPERLDLLTNPEVIARAGRSPATPDWDTSEPCRPPTVWRRDDLIAVFNWLAIAREIEVDLPGTSRLRDLWARRDLGWWSGRGTVDVAPLSVRLLALTR